MLHSFFERHGFRDVPGVVAVSGGPDSVALACLLSDLGCFPRLVLAHLNHQLRGADSDADERFVQTLQLPGATHRCHRIDIRVAAAGENIEKTARNERYRWFAQVAQEEGAGWVATGHTADDQAETVLHRLVRGTGLQGLRGIAERRPLENGIPLLRPMLHLRRSELLAYLDRRGQAYRIDATNRDTTFTRNRIRAELIPLLESQFNGSIIEILGRLAENAGHAFDELAIHTTELLVRAEKPRAGAVLVFDVGVLRRASRFLIGEMFRTVWQRESWPADGMNRPAWERLIDLVFEGETSRDFAGGIHARRRGDVLQLKHQAPG